MAFLDGQGQVSQSNNTTATLTAGSTFTGVAEDVSMFASIVVSAFADQDGIMYIEFSPDGTNWDASFEYAYNAGINEQHKKSVINQYVRVRFTNTSASNQATFRLQTLFGSQTQLNAALNSVVETDADAFVVRDIPFNLLVANGKYQNHSVITKDGLNDDIDIGSVPEDVWGIGGLYTGFVTTTETLTAVSGDAGDTGTLYFFYLEDSTSTDYQLGSLTLAGMSAVTTAFNVWRCNFAYYDDGTANPNTGQISLYQTTTTANLFCIIAAGYGQSFCSAYTTPAGAFAYLDNISGAVRGGATASLEVFFYYKILGESPRLRYPFTINQSSQYVELVNKLIKIPGSTDITPRIMISSANNVSTQVSYRIIQQVNM